MADSNAGGLATKQQRRYSTSSSLGRFGGVDGKDTSYVSETESIRSILVRTGVYQGDNFDATANGTLAHKDMIVDKSLMRPNHVSDNVYEAVKLVYELENYS